jgi:Tfp pilus assembly protein PilN
VVLDLALPEESAGSGRRRVALALAHDPAAWAALAAAVVLAAGVPAVLQARLRGMEGEVEQARAEYRREAAAVAADSARVAALQADSARLAGTLGTLAALEVDRYRWPRLMDAAARALPAYAWMEGLDLEPGAPGEPSRFRVRAVAPSQAEVSRYERALGAAAGARQVMLEGSESLEVGPFALVAFRMAGMYGAAAAEADQPRPGGAGYHAAAPPEAVPPTHP